MMKFTGRENESGRSLLRRFKIELIKYAYTQVGDFRGDVADFCGMNVKTIFNWVHKYDELKDYRNEKGFNSGIQTQYDKEWLWKRSKNLE